MIRKTQQREVIKSIVFGSGRALSVNEIYDEALKTQPTMGISTVYRTLKSLLESAEITTVEIGGEAPRYELAGLAHHHHFKCNTCEKVFDLMGCLPQLSDLLPKGFKLHTHEITLFGKCAKCA
jgi:Fur family transcriptional regulator, ferric uptake regulator